MAVWATAAWVMVASVMAASVTADWASGGAEWRLWIRRLWIRGFWVRRLWRHVRGMWLHLPASHLGRTNRSRSRSRSRKSWIRTSAGSSSVSSRSRYGDYYARNSNPASSMIAAGSAGSSSPYSDYYAYQAAAASPYQVASKSAVRSSATPENANKARLLLQRSRRCRGALSTDNACARPGRARIYLAGAGRGRNLRLRHSGGLDTGWAAARRAGR